MRASACYTQIKLLVHNGRIRHEPYPGLLIDRVIEYAGSSLNQGIFSFRRPTDVPVTRNQLTKGHSQRLSATLFRETLLLVHADLPLVRDQVAGPPAIHPEGLELT